MTTHRPCEPAGTPPITPQVLLDAGGESWGRLGRIADRRIAALAPGEILEIATGAPGVRLALHAWCNETGHVVVWVVEDGDRASCWIRKAAPRSGHE